MVLTDWIILVVSIFMIAISALSNSKEDVMDAFTGGSNDLNKNKKSQGLELVLARSMAVLSIVFLILVIISNNTDRFFM